MQSIAMALPVRPGKETEARAFAKEALGPRRSELEKAAKRLGIHHEEWFLQKGEQGTQLIGFMEADNIEQVFQKMNGEMDGFFGWYKDHIRSITGVDLNQGPPMKPEQIANFHQ